MCGGGGSLDFGPSVPPPPVGPRPIAAVKPNPAVTPPKRPEEKPARKPRRGGRVGTVLTGGGGLTGEPTTTQKTLLGG